MTLGGQESSMLGKQRAKHVETIASRVVRAYYPAVHIRHQKIALGAGRAR